MGVLDGAVLFMAMFANVFFLGFNSKNVHQSRYVWAFCTSWGITVAQYFFVKYAVAGDGFMFIAVSGFGGSLGIIAAIAVHDGLARRKKKVPSSNLRIVEDWTIRDQNRGKSRGRRVTDQ